MAAGHNESEPDTAENVSIATGGLRIEWAFSAAILISIAVAAWRLSVDGYLPTPFYFRVDQTLMDLYSTAYWANHGGAYLTWNSVYPPLSFVLLKVISIGGCYVNGPLAGRLCDWRSAAALALLFVGNLWLVFRGYRWMRIRAAAPRTIATCIGLPMLYTLERGNLLIPCFTCFVLGFGDLLRWRGARWLAMALAMNFKPYLVFSVLPFVARRAWLGLIACGVLFIAVYGLTYLLDGAGTPLEVIANESKYAAVKSDHYFSDLYFATAYWPLIRLLRAAPPGLTLAPPAVAAAIALGLEAAIRLAQLAFAACCAVALFRPGRVDIRRFGAMVACISLTAFTTGSAGYVQIFLFFLLFYEPWRGSVRIAILTCAYLLCLPLDLTLLPVVSEHAVSFLTGRSVVTHFGVTLGQLVRPGLLLVIQFGLVAINFADLSRRGGEASRLNGQPVWFSAARPPAPKPGAPRS